MSPKRYSKLEIYTDVKVEKTNPVSEHKHSEFHAFVILVLYSTNESVPNDCHFLRSSREDTGVCQNIRMVSKEYI
jgi:hypothetical protein